MMGSVGRRGDRTVLARATGPDGPLLPTALGSACFPLPAGMGKEMYMPKVSPWRTGELACLTVGQVRPLGIPCGAGIMVVTPAGNTIALSYA